jgi:hypothetical protein
MTPALREAELRDAEAGPAEAPATIDSPRHQPRRKVTQGHRDVSGFRSYRRIRTRPSDAIWGGRHAQIICY